ncbi:uncharacterized protein J3R85_002043 [Psidium guajava]|nr:uncharacterized protein J3R85_002043 [Psidium guajava]
MKHVLDRGRQSTFPEVYTQPRTLGLRRQRTRGKHTSSGSRDIGQSDTEYMAVRIMELKTYGLT